jgi:hypothetical protein
MSPAPTRDRCSVHSVERRSRCRYPLDSELQCKVIRSGQVYSGKGVDISSGGICFVSSELLPIGTKVEISIDWPVRLSNVTPLQIRVIGHVIRHDKRGTAIKTLRYEFHTRKSRLEETATVPKMQWRDAQMMQRGVHPD